MNRPKIIGAITAYRATTKKMMLILPHLTPPLLPTITNRKTQNLFLKP